MLDPRPSVPGSGSILRRRASAGNVRRSLTLKVRGVPIDSNHGIRDGHGGAPVPVSQSLRAFNTLAAPLDRFIETEVEYFTREARVPPHLRGEAAGSSKRKDIFTGSNGPKSGVTCGPCQRRAKPILRSHALYDRRLYGGRALHRLLIRKGRGVSLQKPTTNLDVSNHRGSIND
jgi:hypothetical protein